jgi:Ger(x)C family germination protein
MIKRIIMIVCIFCLTGCWDRTEVNDMAFVIATGIDKMEENKFKVSVQVPLPSAMGGQGSSGGGGGTTGGPFYVDSGIGRNVREANDDLQKRMSRELYFGHRRVLIFGEKLAQGGVERSLDVVLEEPQSRLSSYVLLTKGDAMKVLNATPHLEQLPAEAIREMAKRREGITVKNVLNDLGRPGKDPVIPVVEVVKTQNGESKDKKDEIKVNGYGVLKHDKLKFYTNKDETSGTLWLLGYYPGQHFTFSVGEKEELNVHVKAQKVDLDYKIIDEVPAFTLKISVNADIEQNEPNFKLDKQDIYNKAIESMEKQIEEEVKAILEHSTSEGIDMYGLGWYLYKTENSLWVEEFKDRWDQLLPELDVEVVVDAEIKRTINSGINIRE